MTLLNEFTWLWLQSVLCSLPRQGKGSHRRQSASLPPISVTLDRAKGRLLYHHHHRPLYSERSSASTEEVRSLPGCLAHCVQYNMGLFNLAVLGDERFMTAKYKQTFCGMVILLRKGMLVFHFFMS